MPPDAWWLFATAPPQPARPVYDTPPVITRRPGWRRWLSAWRCL
jgi:hypothetical protein